MPDKEPEKTKQEAFEEEVLAYKLGVVIANVLFAISIMFLLGGLNEVYEALEKTEDVSLLLVSYIGVTTIIFVLTLSKIVEVASATILKKHKENLDEINKKYDNISGN